MVKPLARTSATVSPGIPLASSASWMLRKRSTILNMWTLLHWLSDVSRPSSGISRLASSTSGVSHGSLKSAVVLKSNDCLRRMGAVEHPSATTATARRIMNRCMAGLCLLQEQAPCQTSAAIPLTLFSSSIRARAVSQDFSRPAAPGVRRHARRVVLTTGFVVDTGVAETDGPPGAAVLGRALRALGAEVRYVTDAVTAPVLAAALAALGEPDKVALYPDGPGAAREILARERPTHLVAIERPGRTRDGVYRNMRGDDVSEWNAPIDELFVLARRPSFRATTIGVGDGGNEIGMGTVRARLVKRGGLAARIASVVRVDHLVVAGVSNWGAYGIVAHLGRAGGRALLHTPDDERRVVSACVAAGACDGVTRRREATVDGLPLQAHAALGTLPGPPAQARA